MGPLCEEQRLQRMAEFHQERTRLRTLARGSILWGAINLVLGLIYLQDHFINFILVLIGLALLLEGIWFSILPSALGVLVDAVVLLVIGLWNVFIVALDLLAGEPPRVQWVVLGLLFIGIALYRMTTFPRVHQLFQEEFSDEELQQMDALMRYITKSNLKKSDDLITLQMQQRQWRAYLGLHYALFLDVGRKKPLATERANVSIEENGKALLSSHLKVRIHIGDKSWAGHMPPGAFAKFQAWKLSDERDVVPESPPAPPSDAYTRRDQIQ
jgi:hypothetical protein